MTESVGDRKARLRLDLRDRRRAMPADERRERAQRLWARTLDELHRRGRDEPTDRVMAFCAFGDEPPTGLLLDGIRSTGAELLLPRVEGDDLVPVVHGPDEPLVTSSIGVPEPSGPSVDPGTLTAVVVPGLAFDGRGRRLGYGAGYYDRFLPALGSDCVVIGVCLAPFLVEEVPTTATDVTVPLVITDEDALSTPD